jgi:hypothetical protein
MPLSRNKKRLLAGALLLLLLLLLAYPFLRHYVLYRQVRADLKLLSSPEALKLTPKEKADKLAHLHEGLGGLSFQEQAELLNMVMEERQEHIRRFFTLSPEEQKDALDEEVDAHEELRDIIKDLYAQQKDAAGEDDGSGPASGGSEENGASTNPPASSNRQSSKVDASLDPNNMTPQERDAIRRQLLDSSRPQDRARLALHAQLMIMRRQQRQSQPSSDRR